MKVFEIKESISQEVRKIAIQNGWLQEDSKESTSTPEMVNESENSESVEKTENSETVSLSEASENISENFETVNSDQKIIEPQTDPVQEVEVVTVKALSEEIKRMKHLIDFRK